MKHYLQILILVFTTVFAYPIKSLHNHIKSGNLDYVERYIQDLSEREISQADFQFLTGFILTDGKSALNQFSKLDISDLSGHLAPVLLYKKGNEQYLNNEFDSAIKSFRELSKKYDKSDYIAPAVSMMINTYLQLGFPDSAQFIRDWSKANIKLNFANNSVESNTIIRDTPIRNYTIQLGAFGKEKNANQTISKFKKTGYVPRVDKITVDGKTLFAVRYGYFETEKEARKIQNKLKQDYAVNSFLKKLN